MVPLFLGIACTVLRKRLRLARLIRLSIISKLTLSLGWILLCRQSFRNFTYSKCLLNVLCNVVTVSGPYLFRLTTAKSL